MGKLIEWQVVREGAQTVSVRAGRPQVALEIDPGARRAVGIAIAPGAVAFASLRLDGRIEPAACGAGLTPDDFIQRPARVVRALSGGDVLCVGLSCTGFLDIKTQEILFSAVAGRRTHVSVAKIVSTIAKEMPGVPVSLTNDMHALSARYTMQNPLAAAGDTMLLGLDDGRIGASLLFDGRPNSGCVLAANELGHSRVNVETQRCYCGELGCIERVFSSEWIRANGENRSLAATIESGKSSAALARCIDLTALAFGNAANLVRPHRIVLASPFGSNSAFADLFAKQLRTQLLPVLRDRVAIQWWAMPAVQSAENAAWAALSSWSLGESNV